VQLRVLARQAAMAEGRERAALGRPHAEAPPRGGAGPACGARRLLARGRGRAGAGAALCSLEGESVFVSPELARGGANSLEALFPPVPGAAGAAGAPARSVASARPAARPRPVAPAVAARPVTVPDGAAAGALVFAGFDDGPVSANGQTTLQTTCGARAVGVTPDLSPTVRGRIGELQALQFPAEPRRLDHVLRAFTALP